MPSLHYLLCKSCYTFCAEEKDGRKEKKKKGGKKSFDSRIRDYRERSRPRGARVGGVEQWRWHSFRRVYIKSSISVEATAVSIRVHFVFANGKADKTFNMFKLASISIIYPIYTRLLSTCTVRGGDEYEALEDARSCDFCLRNIEGWVGWTSVRFIKILKKSNRSIIFTRRLLKCYHIKSKNLRLFLYT